LYSYKFAQAQSADIAITLQENDPKAVQTMKPKEDGGKKAKGAYHMERWLNETGKEEAWSVYARQ
jgi:hypothetical protein